MESSSADKSIGSLASQDIIDQVLKDLLKTRKGFFAAGGQTRQLACMLMLVLLPVAMLLGVTVYFMTQTAKEKTSISTLFSEVDFYLSVGRLAYNLQRERDVSILDDADNRIRSYSSQIYEGADLALEEIPVVPPGSVKHLKSGRNELKLRVWDTRLQTKTNLSPIGQISIYSHVLETLRQLQLELVTTSDIGSLWKRIVAYYRLIKATDLFGKELIFARQYFSQGSVGIGDLDEAVFVSAIHISRQLLSSALENVPHRPPYIQLTQEIRNFAWLNTTKVLAEVLGGSVKDNTAQVMHEYFDSITLFIGLLFHLQDSLAQGIKSSLEQQSKSKTELLTVGILLTLAMVAMTPVVIRIVVRLTGQLQQCVLHLADATKELRVEKRRTDTLLYQMLPRGVADKLKKGSVEAEFFNSCSILFSGVEDFVNISTTITALEVVGLLNDLFSHYDDLIDRFDVYKVESVGEVYMVSSGVPRRNGKRHAAIIAEFALELRDSVLKLALSIVHTGIQINLLIGINTGSCVGGVVGQQLPRYCLFGDTVNTASRMQTTGIANRIQITNQTQKHLSKTNKFIMEQRGEIDIKGKGKMVTHWLLGKKIQSDSLDASGSDTFSSSISSSFSSSLTSGSSLAQHASAGCRSSDESYPGKLSSSIPMYCIPEVDAVSNPGSPTEACVPQFPLNSSAILLSSVASKPFTSRAEEEDSWQRF